MVEATESKFFTQLKAESLNGLQNNAEWQIDLRQEKQIESMYKRIKYTLEDGVLLKLKLQRNQELEKLVATKCFKRSDLSFEQASMC